MYSKSGRGLDLMKTASAKAYKQAKTPFEYLMQRVYIDQHAEDPCWVFTGGKDKDGYGQCHAARCAKDAGVTRAHQLSYVCFNGDIPSGLWVLHKCDNPSCVNPEHLFLGTAKDNNEDMWSKGRWRSGNTPKYDREYIVSQHGKKSSITLAEELGCSFSLICQIWREHGKTGKNWIKGDKCRS